MADPDSGMQVAWIYQQPLRRILQMEMNALSPDQRQYLQQINDRLIVIERHAKREALTLIAQLEARIQDPQDWLCDYEIELEVSFYPREDDPAYQDDEDNILATTWDSLKGIGTGEHPIASRYNWNEFQCMDGDPQQQEHHCWLYHHLYDHSGLRWEDLLRIGHIWVDLQVTYQSACEVEG
jgi:hypothetical protein